MDFRRSGQLDERRRRVLMDEIVTPTDTEKAQPAPAKGPVRAYHESVLCERQRRVSDFIPLRPFSVLMTILLLLTAVAVIEALYIFTSPLEGYSATLHASRKAGVGDHAFAALDLGARGNIASWFSSLVFAGGCLAVLGLLSIRVHRIDDYRGRYRVWWWVAAAMLWGSIDSATGLHDALGEALQLLAGDAMPGGGKLLWIGIYGLVFGTLATRAAFEIWSSLLTIAPMTCAGLLYCACIGVQLEMLPPLGDAVLTNVVSSSLAMLAHVSLVFGVVLYARHVHLDAQGRLLVNAEPKSKKKSKSKTKLAVVADGDEKAEKKTTAKKDEKKEAPAPAAGGLKFGSSSTPQASASIGPKANSSSSRQDDHDEEDEDDESSMSRAERRRLKKLARREAQQGRRAA